MQIVIVETVTILLYNFRLLWDKLTYLVHELLVLGNPTHILKCSFFDFVYYGVV